VLHLRVFVEATTADRVTTFLLEAPGVRHIGRNDPAETGLDTLITADVDPRVADRVLDALCAAGVAPSDAYFVRLDSIGPVEIGRWRWLGPGGDGVAWTEIVDIARSNARLLARYLAFMAAAGSIAAVGVGTANQILIVGGMAVSPDLLPLSALCVGLVARRRRLVVRALMTLVAGLVVAGLTAALTGALLDWRGFLDHPLGSGGLGTLARTDVTTVLVAFSAGIAGMLAFETRAAAAVGVAISVTTIPALAYFAVAAVLGRTSDAWGAFLVLDTNVLVLLAAGTLTLGVQRAVRARRAR
jgi:uncharacterized hydrophobic protein (TIGR00271 family)